MSIRFFSRAVLTLALFHAASRAGAQDAPRATALPTVRVTLQLDGQSSAQFDARTFDLRVQQPAGGAPAEVQLVKPAGAHTGDLLRLSATGVRAPTAVIEVLDSLGAAQTTLHLTDVSVVSDHVSLSSTRAALAQQRISQQEALSVLTADYQEAQRQLATVEELGKSRVATRLDLARARDRASDLQRRIDLLKQRQALVDGQLAEQGPLEETIVLHFTRLEIESGAPGGRATIELGARSDRRN